MEQLANNPIPGFLTTLFDERQMKQIEFSLLYAQQFHHGADGHNSMMIIAKLVEIIRDMEAPLFRAKPTEKIT